MQSMVQFLSLQVAVSILWIMLEVQYDLTVPAFMHLYETKFWYML
jgi:hypothetical protein